MSRQRQAPMVALAKQMLNSSKELERFQQVVSPHLQNEAFFQFITTFAYPPAHANRGAGFQEKLRWLLSSAITTPEQLEELARHHHWFLTANTSQEPGDAADAEHELTRLLSQPGLPVPLLGTITRMLHQFSFSSNWLVAGKIASNLLDNSDCPPEVAARLFRIREEDDSGWWDSYSPEDDQPLKALFREKIASAYPELAGLPDDLTVAILVEQPIPAAWHEDVWKLDGKKRSTDLLKYSLHPLWLEVIGRV